MKNTAYFILVVLMAAYSCKSKKTELKDGETVGITEFIDFFPEADLPYTIADTTLKKKETDSLLIGNKVFSAFVPDSVLKEQFGKSIPKIYPLGRATVKNSETYLFLKASHGSKKVGYLLVFDKEKQFRNSLVLVKSGFDSWRRYGSMDKKFTITTYREKGSSSAEPVFKRNIYVYNTAANIFTLIMTEPNVDIIENVINPIDTLAHTNKNTGDYVKDKHNFISFRNGRNEKELLFFVHFEKNKRECIGELKGRAKMISSKTAQYSEIGNPCQIQFTFGKTSVTMKELGGCGSYRNIKCFFEGTYPKKKAPKSTSAKKKK